MLGKIEQSRGFGAGIKVVASMAKHQTSVTILSGGLYGEHQTSVTVVGNTVVAEPLDRYDNCRWKYSYG